MSVFTLHSQLEKDSFFVTDLALCQVRMINDSQYPWLILIPRQNGIVETIDLTEPQQLVLCQESALTAKILKALHNPNKLNIAAIGNKVSQCHVHHIARFHSDPSWPDPVWGKHVSIPYSQSLAAQRIAEYQSLFNA